MSSSSLTFAVIGLECSNIVLMSLLLATPAPKHSMVKALVIACILRSILDLLPSILERAYLDNFNNLIDHPTLASFCVSDSVLLRYATVVKAAFAVSFTLPALWLSIIHIRPKRSADDYPRLTRRTILWLCVAPFVWALPVLLVSLPHLIRGEDLRPSYQINTCYFDDNAFTVVSLIFTLVPLVVAVFLSVSVALVIPRWSDAARSHRATLCSKRSARFGALVLVTIISASLYVGVLVKWINDHSRPWGSAEPLRLLMRTSVIWEAVTPILFFLIFAAQEEIYETWLGWLSRIVRMPCRKNDGRVENGRGVSQYMTYDSYISPANGATYSMVPCDGDTAERNVRTAFPGKIISLPLSSKFLHQSLHGERRPHGADGLSPPPRPHPSHPPERAVEETTKASRRPLNLFPTIGNLSLSAFGSQPSTQSNLNVSTVGEVSAEEVYIATTTVESTERIPWGGPRSDTPVSTRTFGRATASRR
ncbi:hypothetical protein ONZ51_g12227 [Trametes cubensis]|uniref:Uncharacterized protein n=1 Tax=Trametes cubensis TaxID=1111947 RepID=A0AAD7X734_9APHY|nr:hypothetical protein ONZ51_g12227 [Trametes cubensis]